MEGEKKPTIHKSSSGNAEEPPLFTWDRPPLMSDEPPHRFDLLWRSDSTKTSHGFEEQMEVKPLSMGDSTMSWKDFANERHDFSAYEVQKELKPLAQKNNFWSSSPKLVEEDLFFDEQREVKPLTGKGKLLKKSKELVEEDLFFDEHREVKPLTGKGKLLKKSKELVKDDLFFGEQKEMKPFIKKGKNLKRTSDKFADENIFVGEQVGSEPLFGKQNAHFPDLIVTKHVSRSDDKDQEVDLSSDEAENYLEGPAYSSKKKCRAEKAYFVEAKKKREEKQKKEDAANSLMLLHSAPKDLPPKRMTLWRREDSNKK